MDNRSHTDTKKFSVCFFGNKVQFFSRNKMQQRKNFSVIKKLQEISPKLT